MDRAHEVLGKEADAFLKSLVCGRTVLSILPSFVFILSSAILLHQFTYSSYRHVSFVENLVKFLVSLTVLTQLIRLWRFYKTVLGYFCETVSTQLLAYFSGNELRAIEILLLVIEPPNLKLLLCTISSFLPFIILWKLPRYRRSFAENLMGWFRMARWNRSEIGSSIYFLENPLRYEVTATKTTACVRDLKTRSCILHKRTHKPVLTGSKSI